MSKRKRAPKATPEDWGGGELNIPDTTNMAPDAPAVVVSPLVQEPAPAAEPPARPTDVRLVLVDRRHLAGEVREVGFELAAGTIPPGLTVRDVNKALLTGHARLIALQ